MNFLRIFTVAVCFIIFFGCGNSDPDPVAKSADPGEPVSLADDMLEKAEKEKSQGLNQLALETYRKFLQDFPDSEKASEVKIIISELEKQAGQATTNPFTSETTESKEALFNKLIRIEGGEGEEGKGLFYDKDVYELDDSKVFITFRWSGSDQPRVRMIIQNFTDKEPLKIKTYKFIVDDVVTEFSPQVGLTTVEEVGGKIVETYDSRIRMNQMSMIEEMITADKAVAILEGEVGTIEREITGVEKAGIDNVIRAYLSIGGMW